VRTSPTWSGMRTEEIRCVVSSLDDEELELWLKFASRALYRDYVHWSRCLSALNAEKSRRSAVVPQRCNVLHFHR
jgi:hypothetical protein